jgi:hypothetical protein
MIIVCDRCKAECHPWHTPSGEQSVFISIPSVLILTNPYSIEESTEDEWRDIILCAKCTAGLYDFMKATEEDE